MSFFVRDNGRQSAKMAATKHKSTSKKRKAAEDEEISSEDDDDLTVENNEEVSSGDDDIDESAHAKRYRLAKQLLADIHREETTTTTIGDDDEDVVGQRLKLDAQNKAGTLHRRVADGIVVNMEERRLRGSHLSPISLAISNSGQFIVSSSKDGDVIKYSLQTNQCVGKFGSIKSSNGHKGTVMAIAIDDNEKYIVTGGVDNLIKVWNFGGLDFVRDFKGHRGAITGLVFRRGTLQLFSSSRDRSVKAWDLEQMGYVDTMFGHQDSVSSIDILSRERTVSCGSQDRSVRVWKVADESQLVFNGYQDCTSIDCVRLINEDHMVSGSMDGSLYIWSISKKKPVCIEKFAHGKSAIESNWIVSIAVFRYTNLIASGSRDGMVRFWKIADDYKRLTAISTVSMVGFINDMAFSLDGSRLMCAVGQEHKYGRWWKIKEAKNSIATISIKYLTE